MCGRTACTLDKHGIQAATRQYSRNNETLKWIDKYNWQQAYNPSYNLSPSKLSPVLVNDTVLSSQDSIGDLAITPMRWGFIPHWYKGALHEYSMKTNNCRLESILEKPTYRKAVISNQRCVILADGFYEWKILDNKKKQPYFIFFPQDQGSEVFSQSSDYRSDSKVYKGPHLLTMAGLFDIWKTPENKIIYSYAVITMDSSKTVEFVHERMPAVLNGRSEISMWLDTDQVPTKKAISILKPMENLEMYPVCNLVNYSNNDSVECIKPYRLLEQKPFKNTALTSWLKRGSFSEPPAKKSKVDT